MNSELMHRFVRHWFVGGILVAALLLLASPRRSMAEEGSKFNLADYRTPASPGFVILGVEPTSIARPANGRSLALALLSQSQSVAAEFSPYWMSSHPTLTLESYQRASMAARLWQNLSVTIATTELGQVLDGAEGTGIGIGVRTLLLEGSTRDSSAFEPVRQLITRIQDQMLEADSAEADRLAALLQDSLNGMAALDPARANAGFNVELAVALSAGFHSDDAERAKVLRWGVWITPTYRLRDPNLDFIAIGRALRDEASSDNLYDLGCRLLLHSGPFEVSGEYLRRMIDPNVPGNESTYRFSAMIEYHLGTGPRLSLSIGEDFALDSIGNPLVILLGLQLGIGQIPRLAIQ